MTKFISPRARFTGELGEIKVEELKGLNENIKNIEDNIYNLAVPLVTNDELPKDLKYLYETFRQFNARRDVGRG